MKKGEMCWGKHGEGKRRQEGIYNINGIYSTDNIYNIYIYQHFFENRKELKRHSPHQQTLSA